MFTSFTEKKIPIYDTIILVRSVIKLLNRNFLFRFNFVPSFNERQKRGGAQNVLLSRKFKQCLNVRARTFKPLEVNFFSAYLF